MDPNKSFATRNITLGQTGRDDKSRQASTVIQLGAMECRFEVFSKNEDGQRCVGKGRRGRRLLC